MPTFDVDPLLYDRMIRKFQSTSEREADGRKKGYSGRLEADLMRSEAKIQALAHPDPHSPLVYRRDQSGTIVAVEQNEEDRPKSKEEGQQKWREVMEQRFLRGEDADFDYTNVDNNPEYDDHEEETRRHEEVYFNDEAEQFIGEGEPSGQTGVQDF
ncbi:coiled-coil domain-containing protein 1 [Elsinoe australis]|uniref:Coiled-coil domain-containing protein 1 n=1 Tax=Elsinoe australis TaxID=40998 RepID=A0A4U7BF12_9PEZI|nr:coiled-coil domain-containing protein 1 [Elsinoe australis]